MAQVTGFCNNFMDLEKIKQDALMCQTRGEFQHKFNSSYKAAQRLGILSEITKHLPKLKRWSESEILEAALKYKTRSEFKYSNTKAYVAAQKRGIIDEVCSHMPQNCTIGKTPANYVWTEERLSTEAKKYKTKPEFEKNSYPAYTAASKKGSKFLNRICSHMDVLWKRLTEQEVRENAKKCSYRSEFEKRFGGSFGVAKKLGILDELFPPENNLWHRLSESEIRYRASLYSTKSEFERGSSGAFKAAKRLGILDELCSNMKPVHGASVAEKKLLSKIQEIYPAAHKINHTKINIVDRPHITRFEIDIFIPELNRGIEYDGNYWHSEQRMIESHPTWPIEDVLNYHQIKDDYFRSQGIDIIHIKEKDWESDPEAELKKCFDFLGRQA